MFYSAADTFYKNVVAAYDEYVAHRDSCEAGQEQHLRTAVGAAVALYHFREHLPAGLKAGSKKLEERWADYALLRGVTNASKHKTAKIEPILVAEATDIKEATTVVLYSDEDGEYSHSRTMTHVACTDGTTRWLDPALTRVLNHWGTLLKDAGECGYSPRPEPEEPGQRYLARTEASTALNLTMLRGLDFRHTARLLKFDNDLGRAVEVDLTGADVQFRIYKPPAHLIDFTMSHPKFGDVTVSVPLSDVENVRLHSLKTDSDRASFNDELLKAHWSEIERMLSEKLADRPNGADTSD